MNSVKLQNLFLQAQIVTNSVDQKGDFGIRFNTKSRHVASF